GGSASGERMEGKGTAIEFEIGRFVPEFLQCFKDLFPVSLLFFDLLYFLARFASGWCIFLLRRGDRVFVPDVVQQGDFQLCSDHAASSKSSGLLVSGPGNPG